MQTATETVDMDYKFFLQAGRQGSSPKSLAQQARDKAEEFFGEIDHTIDVEVHGRPDNFTVECHARAKVMK